MIACNGPDPFSKTELLIFTLEVSIPEASKISKKLPLVLLDSAITSLSSKPFLSRSNCTLSKNPPPIRLIVNCKGPVFTLTLPVGLSLFSTTTLSPANSFRTTSFPNSSV